MIRGSLELGRWRLWHAEPPAARVRQPKCWRVPVVPRVQRGLLTRVMEMDKFQISRPRRLPGFCILRFASGLADYPAPTVRASRFDARRIFPA